jgi:hypothetical protein
MGWEYQIVKAETADLFQAALNAAGIQGWEAVFGGYMVGEATRVSLGHGMPLSTRPGIAAWSAVMKRATNWRSE